MLVLGATPHRRHAKFHTTKHSKIAGGADDLGPRGGNSIASRNTLAALVTGKHYYCSTEKSPVSQLLHSRQRKESTRRQAVDERGRRIGMDPE